MKKRCENRILKMLRTVSHKNIDISSLVVFVCPHYGMVTHLDGGIGRIGALVHACKHVHIGTWRLIVGVPLFIFHREGASKVEHRRVRGVFDDDCRGGKFRDMVREWGG